MAGLAQRVARFSGRAAVTLFVVSATFWGTLAIYYSNLPGYGLRLGASGLFILAVVSSFCLFPRRGRTAVWFTIVFLGIVLWWSAIPASNDRTWERDAARIPYAVVAGDKVTINNIRNFTYRTETDFDGLYYSKTFDLARLSSVDLIAVYWMGDAIAHIMLSFGFDEREFIAFSIETRKEQGEEYSAIKGFFKQYELIYIAGDERDLIRVRTTFRNPREDVYLYRTRISKEDGRKLFMEYIGQINGMKATAEWYNTLTTNCTTNIVRHVRAFGGSVQYSWKVLLSGYTPRYAYDLGGLDRTISFDTLRKLSYINQKVLAIGDDPEFSRKIREGLPQPVR